MLGSQAIIIEKDGQKAFAVLPCDEFVATQELLGDFQDLVDLREAKQADDGERLSLDEVKRRLGG